MPWLSREPGQYPNDHGSWWGLCQSVLCSQRDVEMPEMTVVHKLNSEAGYSWKSYQGWKGVSFTEHLLCARPCVKGFSRGLPMSSSQSSHELAFRFCILWRRELRVGGFQALFVTKEKERKILVNSQGLNFYMGTDWFAYTFQPQKSERGYVGGF